MRAIHLSSDARIRHGLDEGADARGGIGIGDVAAARLAAHRINADRAAGRAPGSPTVTGGELIALGVLHEVSGLPPGSRVGVVCASERGAENIAETLAIAGTKGVELIPALIEDAAGLALLDRTADLILMSREALANGLDARLSHPERVRPWTYEFDPAGLERSEEHTSELQSQR